MRRTTQKVINKKTGKRYYYKLTKEGRVRIQGREYGQLRVRETRVVKAGKVNQRILGKYLSGADTTWKNKIRAELYRAQALNKTYTVQQIEAMAQHNQIAITMANTGLSTGQIAKELGVTEKQLVDTRNWNPKSNGKPSDIFTNPETGKSYQFIVNYEGESFLKEIAI